PRGAGGVGLQQPVLPLGRAHAGPIGRRRRAHRHAAARPVRGAHPGRRRPGHGGAAGRDRHRADRRDQRAPRRARHHRRLPAAGRHPHPLRAGHRARGPRGARGPGGLRHLGADRGSQRGALHRGQPHPGRRRRAGAGHRPRRGPGPGGPHHHRPQLARGLPRRGPQPGRPPWVHHGAARRHLHLRPAGLRLRRQRRWRGGDGRRRPAVRAGLVGRHRGAGVPVGAGHERLRLASAMSQFPPNAPPDPPTGSVRGQAPCPRLALRRWALALLTLLACAHAAAQSYQWRDVVQQVEIRPDGSVLVDDTRTLWTDEDFGQAFICLALTRGQRVTLLEGSGAVSSGPPARAFTQRCDGGTELVVERERRVAERRVRFVYLLEGTVDAYSDVVQWYWQVLEAAHPPVRGYQLTVRAPGPMSAPYDAYVHRFGNPEQPRVTLSDDRSALSVAFDRVPSGDGVEIRYLMDPALFTLQGRTPGFERLLEDEARIAGVETGMQARRSPWWALVPLTLFV